MVERTRIGFYYVWDSSWMGGVMYARNLLKALNSLEDKDKPFIDVYCRNMKAFEDLETNTNYPYLDCVIINDESILKKVYRKFVYLLLGEKASLSVDMFKLRECDEMLYPCATGSSVEKLVFWKPDFQEKHLPEFFSEKMVKARDRGIRSIASRGIPFVFSSYDSENDFKKFYPEFNNKTFVVHFAVDHEDFSDVSIDYVKEKYGLKGDYLICANQFWKHKNHLFLFKAYYKALKRGLNLQLACTGNMNDFRDPDYINQLNNFLDSNNLRGSVVLLGLIESKELY